MRREGFGLLELMAVVAVIGVLAVIALPRLTDSRSRVRTGALNSQVERVAQQILPRAQQDGSFAALTSDLAACTTVATSCQLMQLAAPESGGKWTSASPPAGNDISLVTSNANKVGTVMICQAYFAAGNRLCASMSMYPFGTASSSAAHTIRRLQCPTCVTSLYTSTGATVGSLVWSGWSILDAGWPEAPPVSAGGAVGAAGAGVGGADQSPPT